ncbi:hypothetical protein TIFTF001_012627 [Ficus carica]|uniref:Senescence regulator n=1 Tax=Ficus carica TaxID=3494 RepID=A0AA88ACN1_FICCA|nr:hypothetical protein TIFTF001_012627 [Ficus carica]
MAKSEEFQESQVIFSDDNNNNNNKESTNLFDFQEMIVSLKPSSNSKMMKKNKMAANSVPVNIPDSMFRLADKRVHNRDWSDEDEDEDELVPPHVIVGRRIAGGKMAYSVCTGNGRTLKGRDLSQVRNSILRMTGFLET